jgi:hypothetical protein
VVTLHNQRDFLFFRRHRLVPLPLLLLPQPLTGANVRYVFDSPTKARLQEIGPRFTLKLRWLKKGLPSVTAPDGRIAHGGNDDLGNDKIDLEAEKKEEDDAMGDIGSTPVQSGPVIPPLDQEQEYEWKWRVSLVSFIFILGLEKIANGVAKDGSFKEDFLFVDIHVSMYLISLYDQSSLVNTYICSSESMNCSQALECRYRP